MRRALLPLLALSLASCPHDFRRRPDTGAPDAAAGDRGANRPDLGPPEDASRPDAREPPDLTAPDMTCVAPCVQTLPLHFKDPRGVAVDSAGTIYVAESGGHRIWVIAGGQAQILAGGASGFDDGPALQAHFQGPRGIALDGAGGIYVADMDNNAIRLISGGTVTTVAGDGTADSVDGPTAQARFANPQDVAADGAGKVYVAEEDNDAVRLIENGVVSTWAGDGSCGFVDGAPPVARLCQPRGVALDGTGVLYVADSGNNAIRKIVGQQVSTLAGDGSSGYRDGAAGQAQFAFPTGVALDQNGTIYVADFYNHRIRTITPGAGGATVATLAGDGTAGQVDGPPGAARFYNPTALAVDSSGTVYVADSANDAVRVIHRP